jgi:hypothetical protein
MAAAFPPKFVVGVGEPNLQELIHVLHHCVKCAQSHNSEYSCENSTHYMHPLYTATQENLPLDVNGVQQRQDMPNEPAYPGESPPYDDMNP